MAEALTHRNLNGSLQMICYIPGFLVAFVLLVFPSRSYVDSTALTPDTVADADTMRYTILRNADSVGTIWVVRGEQQKTLRTYLTYSERGQIVS